ncbi:cation efflux protein [Apiospora arundinis]|uniref:Cation efflux protein n=1 Tax=Apiospora arundinis TaxID=335852 RepID=A0ABR2IW71_9PEZI
MAGLNLTSKQKLIGTIAISFSFFVAEIVVAFMTGSLALLADAFHYLNDLIGFVVALAAIIISQDADSPQEFSFGWARASLLGAFFNGVFLLALGVSIFLQSIERFISLTHVENPKLMLIMGCVGLTLNILSAALLHEHHGHHHHGDSAHHSHVATEFPPPGEIGSSSTEDFETLTPISAHADHRHTVAKFQPSSSDQDLGMLGVLTHVLSDALNNIGVIIAALVVWLTHYDARFYADPGVSMGIAVMIFLSSFPLVKNSGKILMESAPHGVDLGDVKHDLEKVPGIESVHELHVWRLNQTKAVASAHVIVGENDTIADFMERARTVSECLHAYGIHSTTLQPEVAAVAVAVAGVTSSAATTIVSSSPSPTIRTGHRDEAGCQMMVCGKLCEGLKCCAALTPL